MKQNQVRIVFHHKFQESARLTCTQNIWNWLKKVECTKSFKKWRGKTESWNWKAAVYQWVEMSNVAILPYAVQFREHSHVIKPKQKVLGLRPCCSQTSTEVLYIHQKEHNQWGTFLSCSTNTFLILSTNSPKQSPLTVHWENCQCTSWFK